MAVSGLSCIVHSSTDKEMQMPTSTKSSQKVCTLRKKILYMPYIAGMFGLWNARPDIWGSSRVFLQLLVSGLCQIRTG